MALKGKYMSVEAGSPGGVGFVGGAVEAGGFSAPGIGIGPKITGLSSPIINEGPVGAGFRLENTMPYIIGTSNPIEQIAVEPSAPLVIREAESIAAAVWEPEVPAVFQLGLADVLKQPQVQSENPIWNNKITEQVLIISQAEPMLISLSQVAPRVMVQELSKEMSFRMISEESSTHLSLEDCRVGRRLPPRNDRFLLNLERLPLRVSTQPIAQEQEVVEEVIEVVKVENKENGLEEEELEVNKFVEDEQASSVRKHEIREAVSRAKKEANRLGLKGIVGWLVAKFLPSEHTGNRSQIIKENGPDGSYTETIEAISGVGQLDPDVAVKRFDLIVEEKKPVKLGKEGKVVGQIDLSRVFKYKLKPSAQEIIVKRFIKKRVPVTPLQSNKTERPFEDNQDLQEVFKLTA